MLVYRDDEHISDARAALAAVIAAAESSARAPTPETAVDLLIELGEFEAAVVDRVFPDTDGDTDLTRRLRTASRAAGRGVVSAYGGEADAEHARCVLRELSAIRGEWLPREIAIRVSEGYAYYALHPYAYAGPARRFATDRSPAHAVCIGIRSIGTSLSAIVAAALESLGVEVDLYSVRPHGHPFQRTLSVRDDLAARMQRVAAASFFLIVDEGPGLSGSSFGAVSDALVALGIPAARIVLFPSWDSDGERFNSESARHAWRRHARYAPRRPEHVDGVDWSAGAWRSHVLGSDESTWPAVQPQHEVRKIYRPDAGIVVRFAGLGRYGRAKLARAEVLAAHALGPAPRGLAAGYLSLGFVRGTVSRCPSPELCDAIAAHAAFLTREFPTDRSPSTDQLELMIETNVKNALGEGAVPRGLDEARTAVAAAPAARIDGRMLPHEWLRSDEGRLMKMDALDHHADHFFPGIQDAGWDLAAAAFEFGMEAAHRERLISRYAALSGDRDVRARLPFYDVAYPAFRLGYATLAAQSVSDTRERTRFEHVIARCRDRLMFPNAP